MADQEEKKMHVMSDAHIEGMVAMVVAAEAIASALNVPVSTAMRTYLRAQQSYARAMNAGGALPVDLLGMVTGGKREM